MIPMPYDRVLHDMLDGGPWLMVALNPNTVELWTDGKHKHFCPMCDQAWWHDDGVNECERVWTLDCPIDIGLGRDSVEPAA